MGKVLEKDIKKVILQYLELKGYFVWDQPTYGLFDERRGSRIMPNGRYRIRGVSDILGCIPLNGKMLAIEVKTPQRKNLVSEYQKQFINNINRHGGVAFVATSLEDVKAKLDEI